MADIHKQKAVHSDSLDTRINSNDKLILTYRVTCNHLLDSLTERLRGV